MDGPDKDENEDGPHVQNRGVRRVIRQPSSSHKTNEFTIPRRKRSSISNAGSSMLGKRGRGRPPKRISQRGGRRVRRKTDRIESDE